MPRTINRNPLGIRKLDVQAERRQFERVESKDAARRIVAMWTHDGARDLTIAELERLVAGTLCQGWQVGVKTGARATRDRVAEALEAGTLVKP